MKSAVLEQIVKEIPLSQEEQRLIAQSLKKVELKRGDLLIRKGQTVLNTHYVYSGCLRTFFIDESGRDHTLQFGIKDWWISDYTALFSAGKATMNIECIQDATIYRLERKQMEKLYIDIPEFETFFRKKLEKRMEAFHRRTLENLALNAKERYISFTKTYSQIEKQVKNYHIASYLGITTESLSRIRKEIAL